jgi:hypothetical protein
MILVYIYHMTSDFESVSQRLDALFSDVPSGDYAVVRDYLSELNRRFHDRLAQHIQSPLNEQAQKFGFETLEKKKTLPSG